MLVITTQITPSRVLGLITQSFINAGWNDASFFSMIPKFGAPSVSRTQHHVS